MDRAKALTEAVQAGFDALERLYALDEEDDPILTASDSAVVIEAAWPIIEGFRDKESIHYFEDRFQERFPEYILKPFGGSVFDYIVGNIRNAVIKEISSKLMDQLHALEFAEKQTAFKSVPKRDWYVAKSRLGDDIAEISSMKG